VTAFLSRQLAETGCNYLVGQFAFGDLTLDETLRSVALFSAQVMPALRDSRPAAQDRSRAAASAKCPAK
jgi:hypothetical protein